MEQCVDKEKHHHIPLREIKKNRILFSFLETNENLSSVFLKWKRQYVCRSLFSSTFFIEFCREGGGRKYERHGTASPQYFQSNGAKRHAWRRGLGHISYGKVGMQRFSTSTSAAAPGSYPT